MQTLYDEHDCVRDLTPKLCALIVVVIILGAIGLYMFYDAISRHSLANACSIGAASPECPTWHDTAPKQLPEGLEPL
jgi:hypothetical protein